MGTKHTAFDQPYERKVHLYHDQQGARINSHIPGVEGRLFANTACKMNSDVPESHITTDLGKVTCKICLSRKQPASRFQNVHNFGSITDSAVETCFGGEPFEDIVEKVFADRAFAKQVSNMLHSNTGARFRYRLNWRRKLILQVEETIHIDGNDMEPMDFGRDVTRWRDATLADLPYPGLGVV